MTVQEFQANIISLQDYLKPHALHLTSNLDDTQDLLQETMYKALRNQSKFQVGTNIKAWLYTIMKHILINNYRRQTKFRIASISDNNDFILDLASSVDYNIAASKMIMDDLEIVVNSLSDDYKIPFLKYTEGYKYQEIADEFQLPLGTVKSRIFLARQMLKKKLAKIQITDAAA